jgi:hypothetical protein
MISRFSTVCSRYIWSFIVHTYTCPFSVKSSFHDHQAVPEQMLMQTPNRQRWRVLMFAFLLYTYPTILVSSSLKFWMQFFYLKKKKPLAFQVLFCLFFKRTRNIFAESPRPYHPHVIPILFRSVCDAIVRSKMDNKENCNSFFPRFQIHEKKRKKCLLL